MAQAKLYLMAFIEPRKNSLLGPNRPNVLYLLHHIIKYSRIVLPHYFAGAVAPLFSVRASANAHRGMAELKPDHDVGFKICPLDLSGSKRDSISEYCIEGQGSTLRTKITVKLRNQQTANISLGDTHSCSKQNGYIDVASMAGS
jgi:hypothetical protein